MSNPKIKQLPSGNYNALVYAGKDANGKRKYKSLTAPTKREVKLMIAEFLADRESQNDRVPSITVAEALDAYIKSKDHVLSPSTIRVYDSIRRNKLHGIRNIKLDDLSASDIQRAINEESKGSSPKTVRNISTLLRSALSLAAPNFDYFVTLPQKIKPDIQIPTDDEMKIIFSNVKGDWMEVPIYLAALCGMRRSEIMALRWEDIDLNRGLLTIRAASVVGMEGEVVRKEITKTTASKRTIRLFKPVLLLLKSIDKKSEYVVASSHPNSITKGFTRVLDNLRLPHYRFHDLRHYAVSSMLALNLPKKYIADYVGHETERMIDTVYGHIMQNKKDNFLDVVDAYFIGFFEQMQDEMHNDILTIQ